MMMNISIKELEKYKLVGSWNLDMNSRIVIVNNMVNKSEGDIRAYYQILDRSDDGSVTDEQLIEFKSYIH